MTENTLPVTVAALCDYPLRAGAPTKNKDVVRWVARMAGLLQPEPVHWVDRPDAEAMAITDVGKS